jgi:hypothetical protein
VLTGHNVSHVPVSDLLADEKAGTNPRVTSRLGTNEGHDSTDRFGYLHQFLIIAVNEPDVRTDPYTLGQFPAGLNDVDVGAGEILEVWPPVWLDCVGVVAMAMVTKAEIMRATKERLSQARVCSNPSALTRADA